MSTYKISQHCKSESTGQKEATQNVQIRKDSHKTLSQLRFLMTLLLGVFAASLYSIPLAVHYYIPFVQAHV